MIRVTIEKLPYGDETSSETLHTIYITNDGTGNSRIGNYHVRLQSKAKEDKTAYVRGHYRRDGVLKLLHMALEAESHNGAIGVVNEQSDTSPAYTKLPAHEMVALRNASIQYFYQRVCQRAEKNMQETGTVSGAHWNAMRQVMQQMNIEIPGTEQEVQP